MKIICAATLFYDGKKHDHQPENVTEGFVLCGRRHHNIFNTFTVLGVNRLEIIENQNQGFLTDTDQFVTRERAGKIAFKAGQTTELKKILYSEDLY